MKMPAYMLIVFAVGFLMGCSESRDYNDNWYKDSQDHTAERDEWVGAMEEVGIPERDARAAADLDFYIENTIRPPDTKVSEREY